MSFDLIGQHTPALACTACTFHPPPSTSPHCDIYLVTFLPCAVVVPPLPLYSIHFPISPYPISKPHPMPLLASLSFQTLTQTAPPFANPSTSSTLPCLVAVFAITVQTTPVRSSYPVPLLYIHPRSDHVSVYPFSLIFSYIAEDLSNSRPLIPSSQLHFNQKFIVRGEETIFGHYLVAYKRFLVV